MMKNGGVQISFLNKTNLARLQVVGTMEESLLKQRRSDKQARKEHTRRKDAIDDALNVAGAAFTETFHGPSMPPMRHQILR